MESSKIVKQIMSDENLLFTGVVLAVFGFYVIAEWQITGGLLLVISGYCVIAAASNTIRRFGQIIFFKLKTLKKPT